MKYLQSWINSLQCSDCHRPLHMADAEKVSCTGCGRVFEASQGIWNMLPSFVIHQEGKEKEKEGWAKKTQEDKKSGWDPPPEHWLSLLIIRTPIISLRHGI